MIILIVVQKMVPGMKMKPTGNFETNSCSIDHSAGMDPVMSSDQIRNVQWRPWRPRNVHRREGERNLGTGCSRFDPTPIRGSSFVFLLAVPSLFWLVGAKLSPVFFFPVSIPFAVFANVAVVAFSASRASVLAEVPLDACRGGCEL